jgi:tRNA modification GTPase
LIQFASLIELELDFAMEDVEFANRAQFEQLLQASTEKVGRLLQSFQLGNVIRHGVTVALIGKPNAGKSTLLNALLNEERAIVSEQAGTTRDTIEEALNIHGIQFRIIDTAGIRSHTEDRIEQAGIQRSMEKMRGADRVIYLFDAEQETVASVEETLSKMWEEGVTGLIIPVANKVDQPGDWQKKFAALSNLLFASAMHQSGIDALKDVLYQSVVEQNIEEDQCLVTNARHVDALQKIQHSLKSISTALQENITGDLLAIEIRTCLHHLGEITGEVTTEDKLDYIFSKFCIGK